ncbi:MAG: hypothetical protein QNJ34_22320 [Xenococcaceae cyanobacterium MO_188.B29]|nr:hypothetical protein [Xenococcaceae cyanobacterium MO_188.B29]
MKNNHSEHWKNLPWHKLRKNLFRLQKRVWKVSRPDLTERCEAQ